MIRQPQRIPTLDNLAEVSKEQTDQLKIAALFAVSPDGTVERVESGIFLLNPTSIEDGKDSNWVAQNVPGQSDPVYQWVGGGARVVRFTALVTADTSDFISGVTTPGKPADQGGFLGKVFSGSIASAFSKVQAPAAPVGSFDIDSATVLDVQRNLNYFRSLMYPRYDNFENPRRLRQSPPLLVFYSGSAINKFPYGTRVSSQSDLWMLTNLRIRVTKQLPNLAPLEAEVEFELTQYNVRSFSRDRFLVEGI